MAPKPCIALTNSMILHTDNWLQIPILFIIDFLGRA